MLERGAGEGREDVVKCPLDVFCRHGPHKAKNCDVKHAEVRELREAPVIIQYCDMQCDNGCGRDAESTYFLTQ